MERWFLKCQRLIFLEQDCLKSNHDNHNHDIGHTNFDRLAFWTVLT